MRHSKKRLTIHLRFQAYSQTYSDASTKLTRCIAIDSHLTDKANLEKDKVQKNNQKSWKRIMWEVT